MDELEKINIALTPEMVSCLWQQGVDSGSGKYVNIENIKLEARQRLQQISENIAAFQELQTICQEEDYYLEIPARQNRSNPFHE
ncbi:MAG: hypothetical protein F6K61_06505 [Sphaerospermopsis sp. SIO1G1]|nr:hypothetical protein [Sphaerospermopsis sp. SIO1G1]